MSLANIRKKTKKAPRLILHGTKGVGKTTFITENEPIFLVCEKEVNNAR